MTKKRAWDLYCKCGDSFRVFPQFKHIPEATPEEREEVLRFWKTLPGSYSFADALSTMAHI
jgi:hypothetical protein